MDYLNNKKKRLKIFWGKLISQMFHIYGQANNDYSIITWPTFQSLQLKAKELKTIYLQKYNLFLHYNDF